MIPRKKPLGTIKLDIDANGGLVALDQFGRGVDVDMSDQLRNALANAFHLAAPIGRIMPDGTVFSGISPNTGRAFYTARDDAPEPLFWGNAMSDAAAHHAHGHRDWRLPSQGELLVLFCHRAVMGGFKKATYWSSTTEADDQYGESFTLIAQTNFSCGRSYLYFRNNNKPEQPTAMAHARYVRG